MSAEVIDFYTGRTIPDYYALYRAEKHETNIRLFGCTEQDWAKKKFAEMERENG